MTSSIVHCAAHTQILIKPNLNIIKKTHKKPTSVLNLIDL